MLDNWKAPSLLSNLAAFNKSNRRRSIGVTTGAFAIQLTVFTEPTPYLVKVNKRRTRLSIEVKNKEIVVKAPSACSPELVESFLLQQQHWIKKALRNSQSISTFERQYLTGETLWLRGKPYTLDIHEQCAQSDVILHDDLDVIGVYLSKRVKNIDVHTRKLLHEFYLKQAQHFIPALFKECEQQTGLRAAKLEFKFYQWRWGCCYQSGKIIINPLLMAAPVESIRCVIIHELCHLKHMNHGAAFWRLNAEHCEHCSPTKVWLKQKHPEVYLPPV